jgi:hypothetical protein
MNIRTSTSSYTHVYEEWELVRCSEALDMGHWVGPWDKRPTGFGFCPHSDDSWGEVVRV